MIINDNQIRHVYNAVDDASGSTFTVLYKNDKFYALVKRDNRFPGDDNTIRTDMIEKGSLRKLVVSKPKSMLTKKKWLIDLSSLDNDAMKVLITFDFINWYGIGTDHFYHKFIEYSTEYTTPADNVKAIKKLIETTFKHESFNPFNVSINATTNTQLDIEEVEQYSNVLLGIDKQDVSCEIRVKVDDNYIQHANPTDEEKRTKIYKPTKTAFANVYQLNELLYAASKNRADLYGYVGTPNVNPTEVRYLAEGKSYYVVDIVYVKSGSGTDILEQRKEMTIIVDPNDWSKIGKIVSGLFEANDAVPGMYYSTSNAAEVKTIGTSGNLSSLNDGEYWIASI